MEKGSKWWIEWVLMILTTRLTNKNSILSLIRAWVSTPPVAALFKEGKAFGFGWDWDCWWGLLEDGWLEFKPHLGEAAVVEEEEEFKLLPWRLLNLEPVWRLETWFGIGLGDELLELLFGFNLEPEPAEPREDLCLKEDAISDNACLYWMSLICPFLTLSLNSSWSLQSKATEIESETGEEWEGDGERDVEIEFRSCSPSPYIQKYRIKMAKGKGKDSKAKSKDDSKSKTKSNSEASENLSAALGDLLDPSSSSGTSLSTASPLHLVQNALDMLDYKSTIELSTSVSIPSSSQLSFLLIFQPKHAIFSFSLFHYRLSFLNIQLLPLLSSTISEV